MLFQQQVTLDEGITIYRCVVQLLPHHAAQEYLRSLDSADRTLTVDQAQHTVATAAARHAQEPADLTQRARLEAESREHDALANRPLDVEGLIRAHRRSIPTRRPTPWNCFSGTMKPRMLSRTSTTSGPWIWSGT